MLNLVLKLPFTEERAAAVLGLFLSLSLPLKPQRGLSFLMKYSPNDLPGPCCSNHSQGKHWSDERAPALPVGAFTQWPGHWQDRSLVLKVSGSLLFLFCSVYDFSRRKTQGKSFGSLFNHLVYGAIRTHFPSPPPCWISYIIWLKIYTSLTVTCIVQGQVPGPRFMS